MTIFDKCSADLPVKVFWKMHSICWSYG